MRLRRTQLASSDGAADPPPKAVRRSAPSLPLHHSITPLLHYSTAPPPHRPFPIRVIRVIRGSKFRLRLRGSISDSLGRTTERVGKNTRHPSAFKIKRSLVLLRGAMQKEC